MIDLSILYDEFHSYSPVIKESGNDMNFSSVRILSREIQWHEYSLYLWDGKEPVLWETPMNLVVWGEEKLVLPERPDWNIIYIPHPFDILDLYSKIQKILDVYADWQTEVLLSIVNKRPIQETFDLASRFLVNPIAMFDANLEFLMKSKELPSNIKDSIWNEVEQLGYTRLENLSMEEQRNFQRQMLESTKPITHRINRYPKETQAFTGLCNSGELVGSLGSVDIIAPFTQGQLSLINMLRKYLEMALINDVAVFPVSGNTEYYIVRMLQGLDVSVNTVSYYLKQKQWDVRDHFIICYFLHSDGHSLAHTVARHYVFRLKAYFPRANVTEYEDGIIAIMHSKQTIDCNPMMEKLSAVARSLDLYCGVSMEYENFMEIKYAFIQAKTALTSCGINEVEQFQTHYLTHITNVVSAATSLISFCHPKVNRLMELEPENGYEYVKALKCYLTCGGNVSSTAKSLCMHRNTLLYWLKRIEDIIGVELDSLDENMRELLLFSCIIMKQLHLNKNAEN